ncbi:hypothetical protein C8R45DRAFT_920596 [Mycena sanguinolenta]|nr:hypothetical protein C8R45DRAFT_920596 [Mycena sanguinolenta]
MSNELRPDDSDEKKPKEMRKGGAHSKAPNFKLQASSFKGDKFIYSEFDPMRGLGIKESCLIDFLLGSCEFCDLQLFEASIQSQPQLYALINLNSTEQDSGGMTSVVRKLKLPLISVKLSPLEYPFSPSRDFMDAFNSRFVVSLKLCGTRRWVDTLCEVARLPLARSSDAATATLRSNGCEIRTARVIRSRTCFVVFLFTTSNEVTTVSLTSGALLCRDMVNLQLEIVATFHSIDAPMLSLSSNQTPMSHSDEFEFRQTIRVHGFTHF